MSDGAATGTLADRISNRLVRHFPRRTLDVRPGRSILSFTFDDAPDSALRHGADVLEAAGARGTFYLAGGLAGLDSISGRIVDEKGIEEIVVRGHELGHHTFAHRKVRSMTRAELEDDLERNDRFLRQFDGRTAPRNFALPFTMATPFAQPALRKHFRTSRGGLPGVNRGHVDPYYLASFELRPDTAEPEIRHVLDNLEREPGWAIVFTHDVADAPSIFGVTPARLSAMVREAVARGFEIATVDAALDRLSAPGLS